MKNFKKKMSILLLFISCLSSFIIGITIAQGYEPATFRAEQPKP